MPHGEVTCGGVDWDVSTANSSLQTVRLTGCVAGKSYAVKMWWYKITTDGIKSQNNDNELR